MRLLLVVVAFVVWMELNEKLLYAFNHPWFVGEAMLSLIALVVWTILYSYVLARILTYKGK